MYSSESSCETLVKVSVFESLTVSFPRNQEKVAESDILPSTRAVQTKEKFLPAMTSLVVSFGEVISKPEHVCVCVCVCVCVG